MERDLRSQISGNERGLVEEYVEKVPNPSLKSEWAGPIGAGPSGRGLRRRSLTSLKGGAGRGRKAHLLPVSGLEKLTLGWVPGPPEVGAGSGGSRLLHPH